LRTLRIAAPAQLKLGLGDDSVAGRWEKLPESTRVSALGLLARLITKTVVDDEQGTDGNE
jgi:hypothetical protein